MMIAETISQARTLVIQPPGPLINYALRNPYWFRDGGPDWCGAPTVANVEADRDSLAKRLRYFRLPYPAAADLADTIAPCQEGARCRTGACPLCQRAIKRYAIFRAHKWLKGTTCYSFTIIPEAMRADRGKLDAISISDFQNSILDCISKIDGTGKVFGGIEVDLCDETARTDKVVWQVHAHIVVETADPNLVLTAVGREFPSSFVHRPNYHRIRPFDNSYYGLSYLIKSEFRRKSFFWNEAHGYWDNNPQQLPAADEVELALWLTRNGLRSRLILKPNWGCAMT